MLWCQNRKVHHDVKKYVMTSKSTSWRQKVRKKYAMTLNSTSWCQSMHDVKMCIYVIRHDVKSTSWSKKYGMVSKLRIDVMTSCMTSYVHHDVKYVMTSKSMLWRQRVWNVRHGIKNYVVTWKVWKCAMTPKKPSWLKKPLFVSKMSNKLLIRLCLENILAPMWHFYDICSRVISTIVFFLHFQWPWPWPLIYTRDYYKQCGYHTGLSSY